MSEDNADDPHGLMSEPDADYHPGYATANQRALPVTTAVINGLLDDAPTIPAGNIDAQLFEARLKEIGQSGQPKAKGKAKAQAKRPRGAPPTARTDGHRSPDSLPRDRPSDSSGRSSSRRKHPVAVKRPPNRKRLRCPWHFGRNDEHQCDKTLNGFRGLQIHFRAKKYHQGQKFCENCLTVYQSDDPEPHETQKCTKRCMSRGCPGNVQRPGQPPPGSGGPSTAVHARNIRGLIHDHNEELCPRLGDIPLWDKWYMVFDIFFPDCEPPSWNQVTITAEDVPPPRLPSTGVNIVITLAENLQRCWQSGLPPILNALATSQPSRATANQASTAFGHLQNLSKQVDELTEAARALRLDANTPPPPPSFEQGPAITPWSSMSTTAIGTDWNSPVHPGPSRSFAERVVQHSNLRPGAPSFVPMATPHFHQPMPVAAPLPPEGPIVSVAVNHATALLVDGGGPDSFSFDCWDDTTVGAPETATDSHPKVPPSSSFHGSVADAFDISRSNFVAGAAMLPEVATPASGLKIDPAIWDNMFLTDSAGPGTVI